MKDTDNLIGAIDRPGSSLENTIANFRARRRRIEVMIKCLTEEMPTEPLRGGGGE